MAVNTTTTEKLSVKPNEQRPAKPQVKRWQIIVGVVVLFVYMVWLGAKDFGPSPPVHNYLTERHDAWMTMIAKQAGPNGDIKKINPKDRADFLKSVSGAPVSPQFILKQFYHAHLQ